MSLFISVLQKEFEVPPYSQPVELGSQIELRCHPPKGIPKPRVSILIKNIIMPCRNNARMIHKHFTKVGIERNKR